MRPLSQWKSKKHYIFWVCVLSPGYPAYSSQAPNCYLCPFWLYNIFPRYLSNGPIFNNKKLLNKKYVFWFLSTTFVRNIYHPKTNLARYHKCISVLVQSTGYACQIFIKLEFSRQIFKNSNIKFHENLSSGSRVVPYGRTDGRTDRQTDRETGGKTWRS
jgi:hypothetical protein